MHAKIAYVYQWATFGGVERVLINRAEAFRQYRIPVKLFIYFYADAGGLTALKTYIKRHKLDEFIEVVHEFHPNQYDIVFSIDTPQLLTEHYDLTNRVIFECHTPYINNRQYLLTLPPTLRALVVPSKTFRDRISSEAPSFSDKLFVLRNFVPWDIHQENTELELPKWARRPIVYLGRVDILKNVIELLDGFVYFQKNYGNDLILVIAGPVSPDVNLEQELKMRGLTGRSVWIPPIGFDQVPRFLNAMRKKSAVFVSCSRGESFGLSVAEAISITLPVLISDIPEHLKLVCNDPDCIYRLGNPESLAHNLFVLINKYEEKSKAMVEYRKKFSAYSFIEDWRILSSEIGIGLA